MYEEERARLQTIEFALALSELDLSAQADASLEKASRDGLIMERKGHFQYSPEYWALDAIADSLDSPPPPVALSSIARAGAGGFAPDAFDDLETTAHRWRRMRLWDGNLVPELVVHDDRHAERVDRLATYLSLPLLAGAAPLLSPAHVLILATASWLHDWGHVGGLVRRTLSGIDRFVSVSEPEDVRRMHGIVSQELLESEWVGMHGVPPTIAPWAALLAGHHQGWTSFGCEVPPRHTVGGVDVRPQTFAADYARVAKREGRRSPSYGVAQRLLALLRVADALDVGAHRVPDHGPHKETFLARSIQTHAWRALGQAVAGRPSTEAILGFQGVVSEITLLARAWALRAAVGADPRDWEAVQGEIAASLGDPAISDLAERRSLSDYVRFVGTTQDHYALHHSVRSVRLTMKRDGDRRQEGAGVVIDVLVRLAQQTSLPRQEVFGTLKRFIEKELRGGEGDQTVGRVLYAAGLRFSEIVDCSEGQPGLTVPITYEAS